MQLGWTPTVVILAAAVAIFLYSRAVHARPPDPTRPRLLDHGFVQLLAMIVVVLMLVHVVTLLAGRPITGGGLPR